ncbi:hypothetical protein AAFF_G00071330 [Aldrovandia affinis]|uniref:Uncharacterized protein n=1 Tax=Aldrovandia affinis TaxID=143900 RepID=A0AAD7RZ22_9TELE|nr:hypothetical protein AAFF_G00071330 [Aldrovandia affinis]
MSRPSINNYLAEEHTGQPENQYCLIKGLLAEGRPQTQESELELELETGGPASHEEGDGNPGLPNRRPSGGRRRAQGQGDQPFLELQQAGFNMLKRELGLLRRSINSRLRRMESRAHPL